MLVAWRSITRRALTSHISQLEPFKNPLVRLSLTAFMVQTRQTTRLAARDEPKLKPVDVKPRTKGEHTTRPPKRARIALQPDERVPPVVATNTEELERESRSGCVGVSGRHVHRERRGCWSYETTTQGAATERTCYPKTI